MRTDIRIDTVRLRIHIDHKSQERRYAQQLEERLLSVLALSDVRTRSVIVSMLQQTETISRHCTSMSEKLEEICDEFEKASRHISDVLNDYITQNGPDR